MADILEQTQAWLINAQPENFTIQLTLIDSELKNDIQRFIEKKSVSLIHKNCIFIKHQYVNAYFTASFMENLVNTN